MQNILIYVGIFFLSMGISATFPVLWTVIGVLGGLFLAYTHRASISSFVTRLIAKVKA